MTFLAPWAMALGAIGAAGALLLHLVARHQPAAWVLPTARFIPERQALVSRTAWRPRNRLLLALRMLLLLSAGAAFARPVIRSPRAPRGVVVLLDRSAFVADSAGARRRALALMDGRLPAILAEFGAGAGSLTSGLIAARRAGSTLGREADSLELVVISPVAARELDEATMPVRALWPGRIRIDRVAMRHDSTPAPALERSVPIADVLGPSLVRVPVHASPTAQRLRRTPPLDATDSAFARAGGTVILWRSSGGTPAADAVALGDDVVLAPLARMPLPPTGRVSARWADGAPAAREVALGAGCLRTVGIGVPPNGDLALRPAFQRIVRGLLAPCESMRASVPADSADIARIAGPASLASGAALVQDDPPRSRIVPWLLGIAIACALGELVLRRRPARELLP